MWFISLIFHPAQKIKNIEKNVIPDSISAKNKKKFVTKKAVFHDSGFIFLEYSKKDEIEMLRIRENIYLLF